MSPEFASSVLIYILCAVAALYFYLSSSLEYWKNKNVSHRKPIPIFGNYARTLLMKTRIGEVTKEIYDEFPNEKFIGAYIGHKKAFIVRDPDIIKTILTKDFYNFHSFTFDLNREPINKNLFSSNGDLWRVLRQNLTPLFTSAKMRNMFGLMADCGKHFEKYLISVVGGDEKECNISDLMPRFSLDVIGSCAFGIQANTMDDNKDNVFRKMGLKIFQTSVKRRLKLFLRQFAKSLFYFFNLTLSDPTVIQFFTSLVRETVDERERSKTTRQDFIELMRDLKNMGTIKGDSIHNMDGSTKKEIEIKVDDTLMAAQSFIFFAAGFETSSTTMSYALFELAKNNELQTKLQKEIDQVLVRHNNQVTYESLNEMELLDMVVCETMRKYPVLGHLDRLCTSDYKIPGSDVTIEKDTRIMIPLLAIHHDPAYYPDPETFNPYRFTKEMVQNRHPYVYMPFGQGPRICIGLRFGKMQVMVGLISLLKHYTVAPADVTPDKLSFDAKAFVTKSKTPIRLMLKKRNLI